MMNCFFKYTLTGLLFLTAFSSCKKEYESIEIVDNSSIQAYIKSNGLAMQEYTGSDGVKTGIYYQIITPGTGAAVNYTDKVFMTYTIKSLDGSYVSTDEQTNRYGSYLGYLDHAHGFPEWSGVLKNLFMKRGGSIRLIIPSHLAYGRSGSGKIPGNASLDCTLNLSDKDNITDFEDIFVQKYITANNITGLAKTSTGLYYSIDPSTAGTDLITLSSTVSAVYSGKLIDGTVFDSNTDANPLSFALTGVIAGWQQGLQLVKSGQSIRLIIPPSLGYGPAGSGKIPGNAILDFQIKITAVTN